MNRITHTTEYNFYKVIMKYALDPLIFLISFSPVLHAKWLPFLDQAPPEKKPLLVLKKEESKKTIRTMSFEELKVQKNVRLAEKNKEMAIKYLEKMIPLCDDLNELNALMLELADLLFDCERLKDGEAWYREFCTLFPGDAQIEYALYKAVLCSFHKLLHPERDQTKTYKTIELADSFLKRQEIFTTYTQEVKKIRTACFNRLAESETNIVKDYTNRKQYQQAQRRIDYIKDELLTELPQLQDLLLTLQNTLLIEQGQQPLTLALLLPQEDNQEAPVLATELFEDLKEQAQPTLFVDKF